MKAIGEREFRETLNALHLNPENGEWDSIRQFNLVMELEARWGAKIPIGDVEKLKTFGDFYRRIPCRPAKVLATDADNTLWTGIVSEDGAENVTPRMEIQRMMKGLKDRGVYLVLLSKNDPNGVLDEALKRTDMILKREDFAYLGVNWEPKAGNLLAAAKALNLSPDAFVFADDNVHERAEMRNHLPEVMTPEWNDAEGLAAILTDGYFAESGRTEEDRLRTQYAGPNGGLEFSKGEYLQTLGLEAKHTLATEADLPRLVQMAGKTNQFNATTIRRNETDFRKLLADAKMQIHVFRARDRFGEMGIVCYVIRDAAANRITDFVMSCRAMGRTLEFFAYGKSGGGAIDFRKTEKNGPFADFLKKLADGETTTYFKEIQ